MASDPGMGEGAPVNRWDHGGTLALPGVDLAGLELSSKRKAS
jgi:hypothetical protein